MYADDIIILSTSKEGLPTSLDTPLMIVKNGNWISITSNWMYDFHKCHHKRKTTSQ